MPRKPLIGFLVRKWRQLTDGWAPYVEEATPAPELSREMHQASIPSFGFFFMLALAATIATFGLIANSAPTIIGAMIVAPLMSPIISLSYGLVSFEPGLIRRSVITVISGVILAMGLAYVTTLLFGLRIAGAEILSRTSPTLIDLGVAMAAGGAAAFSHTRRSILSSDDLISASAVVVGQGWKTLENSIASRLREAIVPSCLGPALGFWEDTDFRRG
ncbi:MAG: DUF389 domain-containing protein, partial [Pseudomonadota bacterium]|nr:DUF389 domain-containing protein [Pseudomonadota bacterium]